MFLGFSVNSQNMGILEILMKIKILNKKRFRKNPEKPPKQYCLFICIKKYSREHTIYGSKKIHTIYGNIGKIVAKSINNGFLGPGPNIYS